MFGQNNNNKEEQSQSKAMQFTQDMEREANVFQALSADDGTYMDIRDEKRDLTRWQQDLSDELEDLRHDLLREVQNSSGKWVAETECIGVDDADKEVWVNSTPMVNKTGFYKIRTVIKRYLSRNMMMTNFSEDIINKTLFNLKVKLICNLGSCQQDYEINKEDIPIITTLVMDSIKGTLYRAYNNGERNYLNTINKRIEAFTQNQPAPTQKKGWLAGLGG